MMFGKSVFLFRRDGSGVAENGRLTALRPRDLQAALNSTAVNGY